mgnify:CR=1 FL=1
MSQRYAITQTKSQLFLNFTHLRTTNAIGYQRFDLEKSGTNLRYGTLRPHESPKCRMRFDIIPGRRILAAASFCRTYCARFHRAAGGKPVRASTADRSIPEFATYPDHPPRLPTSPLAAYDQYGA